jgi:primosomal protein N'
MIPDLFSQPRAVPVMVPLPSDRPYSYLVPDGMAVEPGTIVRVPLGPREVAGIVWDGEGDDGVDPESSGRSFMSSAARRSPDPCAASWIGSPPTR